LVNITIRGLSFGYRSRRILKDLNLIVEDSEILGLVGPNGSGKTTLIKCMDRILKPAGSIILDGQDIKDISQRELARQMGYVPQSSPAPPNITVFDSILMGRRPHLGWRVSENDLDKVVEVMEMLHIEDFAMKDFSELSGGQRQKVLIARALAQEPSVLLLDEPTSNLDMKHQLEVMETIRSLVLARGISAVMAIHDLNLACRFVDKLAILKDGTIHAAGEPSSLLTEETIRSVYGVEAVVMGHMDRPYVVPLRSLNEGLVCE